MTKPVLRKKYRARRSALSEDNIQDLSLQIANKLLEIPIWEHDYYHTFLTITELKEVNTDFILNILAGKDKNIIVSKTILNSLSMQNYLLTDSTIIRKNASQIPEPVDGIEIDHKKIDVVFVPLLAYDKNGNRVGYGKGFYDRFFSNCNSNVIKVGLSFFEAEEEIMDITKTDIPLDYCITPKKIYNFSYF